MNPTIKFAEEELYKYLVLMTGERGEVKLSAGADEDIFREKCAVSVTGGKGEINANCPRALLLGVYGFLRSAGCRFVRPGKKGEYVPRKKISDISAHYVFEPYQRHRGITIEGAVSKENVTELIDWAAKAGFNSYFTQFGTSAEFFERWYRHLGNPFLAPEEFDDKKAAEFLGVIVKELKKRSMIYHSVGHGWTTRCLGMDCNGWKESSEVLPPEKKELIAMVNGKRNFFKGKPLNTHLCYSNPKVRTMLAQTVADYAESHPETDILHFWLADDYNNACECGECAKKNISDWYVMILNEIDKLLTSKGLKVKVVFLVYLELYWPPLEEKIVNPDRFIMLFAPIFRSYFDSYKSCGDCSGQNMLEYDKNKMTYPKEISKYLRFLSGWKKVFSGDCIDFDYHLMWDINRDFGGEALSEVLFDDIRSLRAYGMNGFLSCQLQRAFYPSGLEFDIMARALNDGKSDYEKMKSEYYSDAFGKFAAFAENYYSYIEKNVSFKDVKEEARGPEFMSRLRTALSFAEETLKGFPDTENEEDIYKESMEILKFAAENLTRLLTVLILMTEGADEAIIAEANKDRKDYFNRLEMRYQPYADGFYVNMITDGIVSSSESAAYDVQRREESV